MKNRTWLSILTYTSARILMFGVAVIVLYMAGARGILLLLIALFVSAIASYILLSTQREKMASALNNRISKTTSKASRKAAEFRERLEEGAASEDDVNEAAHTETVS